MKKTTPINKNPQEPDIIALAQSYINGDKEITGLSENEKIYIFTQLEAKVQRIKIEFDKEYDKLENNTEAAIALGLWVEKLSIEKELEKELEKETTRVLGSLISRLKQPTSPELLPPTEIEEEEETTRLSELKSLTALASSPKNASIFAPADTVIKAQKNLENTYGLLRKLEVMFGLKTSITESFLMDGQNSPVSSTGKIPPSLPPRKKKEEGLAKLQQQNKTKLPSSVKNTKKIK